MTALGDSALAPRGHTTLPLFRDIKAQQPSQTSPPSNLTVVNPCPAPAPPPPRAYLTPGSSPASAPLGLDRSQAFQKMQTPGQSRGRALGGIPHTATGCTTGQAPTCLRCVARTRRPSGWGTGRGRRWPGRWAGVQASPTPGTCLGHGGPYANFPGQPPPVPSLSGSAGPRTLGLPPLTPPERRSPNKQRSKPKLTGSRARGRLTVRAPCLPRLPRPDQETGGGARRLPDPQ